MLAMGNRFQFVLFVAILTLGFACPGPTPLPDSGSGGGSSGADAGGDTGYVSVFPRGQFAQGFTGIPVNGNLVVAGNASFDGGFSGLLVAQVKADRTLESTFGTSGSTVTKMPLGMLAGAINLASDSLFNIIPDGDGYLAVGTSRASTIPGVGRTILARYLLNGQLDVSFGTEGIRSEVWTENSSGREQFGVYTQVIRLPDGKILTAGEVNTALIVRRESNGAPDTSFSRTDAGYGTFLTATGALHSLIAEPDGRVTAAGTQSIVRLTSTGKIDIGFATMGAFRPTGGNGIRTWREPDGSYLHVSFQSVNADAGENFSFARFTKLDSNGAPDVSFGPVGVKDVALLHRGLTTIRGIVRTPDGKFVLYLTTGGPTYLARINADFTLDNSIFENGDLKKTGISLPLLQPALQAGKHLSVDGNRWWITDINNVLLNTKTLERANFFEVVTGTF
jgi:uncharacterized delta-60 repeat protein